MESAVTRDIIKIACWKKINDSQTTHESVYKQPPQGFQTIQEKICGFFFVCTPMRDAMPEHRM